MQTPRSLYVHFPYAEIKIGEEYLCTNGYRFNERPEIGAEVILVLEEHPGEQLLVAPQDHALFYRNPDDEPAFPHDYQYTDQSLSEIASAFSGEAGP